MHVEIPTVLLPLTPNDDIKDRAEEADLWSSELSGTALVYPDWR